jgi:hypothetical protein
VTAQLEAPATLEDMPAGFQDAWAAAVEAVARDNDGLVYSAVPAFLSPIPAETNIRAAHIGAAMLGMPLTPQGCQLAGVLEALDSKGLPLYDDVTVQIPRRSTKTTSVQCTLLGRCELRPGYRVIQTAQDGTRASAVFMDMVRTLEQVQPDESKRNWVVFKSTGREFLQWNNGSRWWVAPPRASSFRGLAADVIFFDESGELDPAESADLMAGALPVMDTRKDGQVIKAGTPGLVRAGAFWDSLEAARSQADTLGIVDYCAKDSEVVSEEQAADESLWFRVHPGLASGLTTLKTLRKRFATMGLAEFVREYLCVWPPDTSQAALDLLKWAATGVTPAPAPPGTPWAMGYDVAIGSAAAAVAVAWFDGEGNPHVQLMEHRVRADWLTADLMQAVSKHPGLVIGYDPIGDNIAAAQALARKPRFKASNLKALTLKEVAAATATIAAAVDNETLEHGISRALDIAAGNASWRMAGGSRLFQRMHGKDISALLAVVHALGAAAGLKKRQALSMPAPSLG